MRLFFTPEEDDIIRKDYAAYVPIREIARKLGRSKSGVHQRTFRLALRRPELAAKWAAKCAEIDQRHDLSRNDKIVAKRAAGMTLEAIGRQHDLTRQRVWQLVSLITVIDC